MKMKDKKVAIYARVSTTGGKQDYQRQVADLTNLITQHGYNKENVEVFAESISGYKKNSERPELSKMIEIIKENPQYFSMIYCTEISRLGRNPSETRTTIDALTDLQVPVFIQSLGRATLDNHGKRDGIMNIILQVLLEFANAESEQMKQRSKSGLLKSARSGRAGGSLSLPYGYTKDENKMLIIDEEEAEIVKRIYSLHRDGNGVRAISNILNAENVPTRFNKAFAGKKIKFALEKDAESIKWSDNTVLGIIDNPLYKGERLFKGETIVSPVIIDPVDWELTQDRKAERRISTDNATLYTYLLKNIIQCGCCGRNFFAKYKPIKDGDKVYICSSRLAKGNGCGNKGINISLLESAIYNELISSDSILKYLNNVDNQKQNIEKTIQNTTTFLNVEKTTLSQKQAVKDRLLTAYIEGVISKDAFDEKNNQVTNQITNAEKKVKKYETELLANQKLLKQQTGNAATQKMLFDAKENRDVLRNIYSQIINKVIVTNLDDNICLASIYIQLNGVIAFVLPIVLNKASVRKAVKTPQYMVLNKMVNNAEYKKDILENREEVYEEILSYIPLKGSEQIIWPHRWITIPIDNILTVTDAG